MADKRIKRDKEDGTKENGLEISGTNTSFNRETLSDEEYTYTEQIWESEYDDAIASIDEEIARLQAEKETIIANKADMTDRWTDAPAS